jgi:hypothetical protein
MADIVNYYWLNNIRMFVYVILRFDFYVLCHKGQSEFRHGAYIVAQEAWCHFFNGCNYECLHYMSGLPDFSWCMMPKPEKMYQMNTKCTKWS